MSKSLKIVFEAGGASLKLDETVEGFEAVTQNGLVNIATEQGSDSGDSKRGTNLLRNALQGRVADLLSAQHISNLAAINTLFYLRKSDETDTTEERVENLALQPFEYDGTQLRINALFTGSNGSKLGVDVTL
jgi:flavodoxin